MNKETVENILMPETIMHNFYNVFPSFAMLAGMQLDVFTSLKDGPMNAKNIACALGVREEKLKPLLYLLVAAGVMTVNNDLFSNTEEASTFLVRGNSRFLGEICGFYKYLWELSLKTAESIKTGHPQGKLDFYNISDEELLAYFQKQVHSSRKSGQEIAEKIDFSKFRHMLDAGGGSGGISIAICTKYKQLKATVADLAKIVKLTENFINEAKMSERINVQGLNFCLEPPEGTYDVVILKAVLQTLSPQEVQSALNNISQSMLSGGTIYIIGNVMKNSRLGPQVAMAFSLVFLNAYDNGNAYTEDEYHKMLVEAGYYDINVNYDIIDGECLISAKKH